MTEEELYCGIAAVTGEAKATIIRLGFQPVDFDETCFDPEAEYRPPMMMDWDTFHAAA